MNYEEAVVRLYPATKRYTEEEEKFLQSFLAEVIDGGVDYGLWGECGTGPYRAHLVSILLERNPKLTFFNPDKGPGMWTPADNYVEEFVRKFGLADFFYLGKDSRGTVSCMEAAAVAFFRNVHYVIRDVESGLTIKGQKMTDVELRILNRMREIVRHVAMINNRPVYEDFQDAGHSMPVSRTKLDACQARRPSRQAMRLTRAYIKALGFEKWIKAIDIEITADPFDAQIETMVAILVAHSRESGKPLTIHVPDTSLWEGVTSHGQVITGRLTQDLERSLQPYLRRLVTLAPTETYFVGI